VLYLFPSIFCHSTNAPYIKHHTIPFQLIQKQRLLSKQFQSV